MEDSGPTLFSWLGSAPKSAWILGGVIACAVIVFIMYVYFSASSTTPETTSMRAMARGYGATMPRSYGAMPPTILPRGNLFPAPVI